MAETYKSGEKVKYRLAEAMKECMKKAPVEKITVKEITEECGYRDQHYFSYCFKKATGMSPNQCRKEKGMA